LSYKPHHLLRVRGHGNVDNMMKKNTTASTMRNTPPLIIRQLISRISSSFNCLYG
jgi:hypothetical protein